MACSPKPSFLSLFLLLLVMLPLAQLTLAGRPLPSPNTGKTQTQSTPRDKKPTQANADKKHTETLPGKNQTDKKQTECVGQEGSVLIPGVGRYMVGSTPAVPTVGGTFLGDSVPAALNGQYLPGFDDTFVPNPGYEVPNPARGAVVP